MVKLLYRGNKYTQHKEIGAKKSVQLKYRKSIYNQKRQYIPKVQNYLTYRGSKYLPKKSTNKSYRSEANKKVFALARDLINAQFNHANDELSRKLWDDVATLKIDPQRIINLMYRCCANADNQSMFEADLDYFSKE